MPILTPEERVGTLLAGRYRLESILGHGGTSTVYEATHTFTGRRVALKLLKPEHARDRELVMRFLREARTASTLVHPNVVSILDMGVDPAGDVYLAMELLRGEPMGELLDREQTLDATRAVELLRPVMEALAMAHERGIVHRDVKPDNVLIGDRGDGVVRPILLDFGMAKMVEAAWGHATQSGVLVGTPFYMSPEQAEGAPDLGAGSDVWSMGVLLYRALGGALPFFAGTPTALLLAIVRGDHVPLRERAPEAPTPIVEVIERALRVDRAERFADMRAMLQALDDALAGKGPAPLARVSSPPEAPSPSRPVAWAAAALVALLVAVGTAWALTAGAPEATAPSPSEPTSVAVSAPQPPPAAERAITPDPVATGTIAAAPAEAPERAERRGEGEPVADTRRAATPPPPAEPATEVSPAPRRRGLARWRDEEPRDEDGRRPGLATEW